MTSPGRSLIAAAALGAALAAAPAVAAPKLVEIGDNFFVKPGGARVTTTSKHGVTWKWTGTRLHSVKVVSGPRRFASKVQKSGSFTRKGRSLPRGTYRIVCALHPDEQRMTLKVR